jgi:hypothetical protein
MLGFAASVCAAGTASANGIPGDVKPWYSQGLVDIFWGSRPYVPRQPVFSEFAKHHRLLSCFA